jgi:hypothetical protein
MIFDWKISKSRRTGQITFYRTAGSLPVISCKPGFLKKLKPRGFLFWEKKKKEKVRTYYSLITKLQKRKPKTRGSLISLRIMKIVLVCY